MLFKKGMKQYGTIIILTIVSIFVELYSLIFALTYNGGLGLLVNPTTDRVYPLFQQITLNYAPAIAPFILSLIIFATVIFISLSFIKGKSKTNKTSDLSIKIMTWAFSLFLIASAIVLLLSPPLFQLISMPEGVGWLLLFASYGISFAYYILGIISFILLVIGFMKGKK
ncbi:MAG: hypothetical protein WCI72_03255 [archaeon]